MTKLRVGWKTGLVMLVAALVLAPMAVSASHDFTDVPDSNIFHEDIAWMLDNGITSGCGGGRYCPSDNVTREQMAAFMKRLSTKKVVDAATAVEADHAVTADSATIADSATTAGSATTADHAATAGSATTAGDSGTLDGLDSTDFMPAGDITMNYNTWELRTTVGAPVADLATFFTTVTDEIVIIPLSSPALVGGTEFGLASVEYCAEGSGSVTDLLVYQSNLPATNGSFVVIDRTTTSPGGGTVVCRSFDVGSGGADSTQGMGFVVTGSVNFYSVNATWSPDAVGAPVSLADDFPSEFGFGFEG